MQYCRSNLLAAQLPRPSGTRCQISTRKMAHAIANSSIRISENMRASLSRHQCRLLRVRSDAPTLQRCQALLPAECHSMRQQQQCSRRELVLLPGGIATALAMMAARPGSAMAAQDITIIDDEPGFGQSPVRLGDLVLVHYTGTLDSTGVVFDSSLGLGLMYRDGGPGVLRPIAIRLGGYPTPGICMGLQNALIGMRVGGRRTVVVPPGLGFGSTPALAPYAAVPANSIVRYEIQLLRLSRKGPDALVKGLSKCSQGGASATAENCANIEPAEFV